MSYSEWVMKYREDNGCKPLMSECYEAGQQSKQEEIDQLKSKINEVLDFIDSDQLGHDVRLGDFYRDIIDIFK